MDRRVAICWEKVDLIAGQVEKLVEIIGQQDVFQEDREQLNGFEINYKNFVARTAGKVDVESAISSAKGVAAHAASLGRSIARQSNHYGSDASKVGQQLQEFADGFIEKINSGKEFSVPYRLSYSSLDGSRVGPGKDFESTEKAIIEVEAKLRSDISNFERAISKGYADLDELKKTSADSTSKALDDVAALARELAKIADAVNKIKDRVEEESAKAIGISEEAATRSGEVHSKIDDLLGQTASKVLLADYAVTADKESVSANRMRWGSLACMAISGGVVCVALYQSLSGEFDWRQLVVKAFAALALSVPAAYLAKESAKHRVQEHVNRRISLDLRAMAPYIASLPVEEQNKIKAEVASKIFGVQGANGDSGRDYPVDLQELFKIVIEKLPSK